MKNEAHSFVQGALILTVAGLLSKVLSASYRIPLQNLTGDFGMYIYQQVYPLLGIVLILSLYGFPSAVARIGVKLQEESKSLSVTHFVFPVFLLLFVISVLLFSIFYLTASQLALHLGDVHLTNTYRRLAIVFLLVPILAVLRGIMQVKFFMTPLAYAQISEQLLRVVLIISVSFFVARGKLSVYDLGKGAVDAAIAGGVIATILLLFFLKKERPLTKESFIIPWKMYIRLIFLIGIVATMSHVILLILQLADTLSLVPLLQKYGLSSELAMEGKGIFDRGQPLIQFGTVIGSSFALTLISSVHLKEQNIEEAFTFGFYLAFGATLGLIIIFPEANFLLFKDLKGTFALRILSLSILLASGAIVIASILQRLGIIKKVAGYIGLSFFIKYVSNTIFVPTFGLTGSAFATVFSLLFLIACLIYELQKVYPMNRMFEHLRWLALLKASLSMTVAIFLLKGFFFYMPISSSRLSMLFQVLGLILLGGGIYMAVLIRQQAFSKDQLEALPFSNLLLRLLKD